MYIRLPYRKINFNTILRNSRSLRMKQSQTVYIYFTLFCKSTCSLFFAYIGFLILNAEVVRVDLYLDFGITIQILDRYQIYLPAINSITSANRDLHK